MAEHDDDLAILLHVYRLGSVYLELLGQLALPAAQRLAVAGVEGAAQAAHSVAQALEDREPGAGSPRQLQQVLREMLFEEEGGRPR